MNGDEKKSVIKESGNDGTKNTNDNKKIDRIEEKPEPKSKYT